MLHCRRANLKAEMNSSPSNLTVQMNMGKNWRKKNPRTLHVRLMVQEWLCRLGCRLPVVGSAPPPRRPHATPSAAACSRCGTRRCPPRLRVPMRGLPGAAARVPPPVADTTARRDAGSSLRQGGHPLTESPPLDTRCSGCSLLPSGPRLTGTERAGPATAHGPSSQLLRGSVPYASETLWAGFGMRTKLALQYLSILIGDHLYICR